MSKLFFEVFPTLKVGDEVKQLFEGVEVTKVTTNSERTFIKIHILSRHLIQKSVIYEVEGLIKMQLFGQSRVQVTVCEKYELSELYTPENIMEEYLESFLVELNQRSVLERSMLQNSKYTFEDDNILCMQLTDTIVAQGKKESLAGYLKDVYANRFGRPIEVRVLYKEAKESKLKYNEIKLQQEVDTILAQVQTIQKKKEEKEERKRRSPRTRGSLQRKRRSRSRLRRQMIQGFCTAGRSMMSR